MDNKVEFPNYGDMALREKTPLIDYRAKTSIKEGATQREFFLNGTLYITYFAVFITNISLSLTLASSWPYLKEIDSDVKETFLGWTNASYNASRFFACFIIGYWKDKRNASEPMYLSMILLITGSISYMFANSFRTNGIYILLFAQIILGISSANLAVARAVCAEQSTKNDAAKVMALVSLSQGLGFVIGPLLQAAVKPIGVYGIFISSINLHLNVYTVPCIFMVVICVIQIFLQYFYFKDNARRPGNVSADGVNDVSVDKKAVIVSIFIWSVTVIMFTVADLLVSPSGFNEFAWSKEETVFYSSLILGAVGSLTLVFSLLLYRCLKASQIKEFRFLKGIPRFEERSIILSGFLIMLIGYVLLLPWGPKEHVLTSKSSNNTDEIIGCPYEYSWCHNTPAIALPQFLVSLFIAIAGYALCMVTTTIIFSKIVGPHSQGKFMGFYTAAGAVSRTLGPVYISSIYQYYGLQWSSVGFQVLLCVTIALILSSWERLVPYGEFKKTVGKAYVKL